MSKLPCPFCDPSKQRKALVVACTECWFEFRSGSRKMTDLDRARLALFTLSVGTLSPNIEAIIARLRDRT